MGELQGSDYRSIKPVGLEYIGPDCLYCGIGVRNWGSIFCLPGRLNGRRINLHGIDFGNHFGNHLIFKKNKKNKRNVYGKGNWIECDQRNSIITWLKRTTGSIPFIHFLGQVKRDGFDFNNQVWAIN
jgi:hypothetical protein